MSNAGERYVERSPLVQLLKTQTRVKLLDAFLRKHYMPLSAEQLAKYTNVSRTSVDRNIDVLIEFGLVEEVEVTSSDAVHYKIDTSNAAVKQFRGAQTSLLDADGMNKQELDQVDKKTALEVTPPVKGLTEDTMVEDTPWNQTDRSYRETAA